MRKLLIPLALLLTSIGPSAWANASDLVKAGIGAQQRGDWSQAADLYGQALALGELSPKGRAQVLGLRANAYGTQGLHDKAIADFTDAIKIAPADPTPLVGRSIVHRQTGDYDRAIADDDAALKLVPDYTFAFTNRGMANFYAGRFAAAAGDFAKSQAADPTEPDFVLWLHLSRARAGQDDAQELARMAAKVDPKSWAGPAVALFLGQMKPEEVRAAAADKNPVLQRQQGCEAAFYLGEDALLHGRKDEARTQFQTVLEQCAMYKINYVYFSHVYGAAQTELKRVGQ